MVKLSLTLSADVHRSLRIDAIDNGHSLSEDLLGIIAQHVAAGSAIAAGGSAPAPIVRPSVFLPGKVYLDLCALAEKLDTTAPALASGWIQARVSRRNRRRKSAA